MSQPKLTPVWKEKDGFETTELWKDGILIAQTTTYFHRIISSKNWNDKGELHGYFLEIVEVDSTDHIQNSGQYLNGKKAGIWIEKIGEQYYRGDNPKTAYQRGYYLDGEKSGEWTEEILEQDHDPERQSFFQIVYGAGTLRRRGVYDMGKKTGLWTKEYYTRAGEGIIISEREYEDGKEISCRRFFTRQIIKRLIKNNELNEEIEHEDAICEACVIGEPWMEHVGERHYYPGRDLSVGFELDAEVDEGVVEEEDEETLRLKPKRNKKPIIDEDDEEPKGLTLMKILEQDTKEE